MGKETNALVVTAVLEQDVWCDIYMKMADDT